METQFVTLSICKWWTMILFCWFGNIHAFGENRLKLIPLLMDNWTAKSGREDNCELELAISSVLLLCAGVKEFKNSFLGWNYWNSDRSFKFQFQIQFEGHSYKNILKVRNDFGERGKENFRKNWNGFLNFEYKLILLFPLTLISPRRSYL